MNYLARIGAETGFVLHNVTDIDTSGLKIMPVLGERVGK
jgi:hypothetical protein